MLAEKELLLISQFHQQEVFSAKESYDKSLIDFLKAESELSTSVGKGFSALLSLPIFLVLVSSNLSIFMSLIAAVIMGVLVYPFATLFGQSNLGKKMNKLFNIFSIKLTEKKENLEVDVESKKEKLQQVILSKETKEFFSRLYVFLEHKLHHTKDKEHEKTKSLHSKIKKIIEAYLEEDVNMAMQKILSQLKNTEKEISHELTKDLAIKNFVTKHAENKKSKDDLDSNEKLFKKDKYRI